MIALVGGDLVLPDRILTNASLILEGSRIAAIARQARSGPTDATIVDAAGTFVVPGFIDVHVHGIDGRDGLDGGDALAAIAHRLPAHGVTAFCPTSVACSAEALGGFLGEVRRARLARPAGAARVLPAHLESNFINPHYRGAQPAACLRLPARTPAGAPPPDLAAAEGGFTSQDVLRVIEGSRPDVGIVTLAPELEGALDLVRELVAAGHHVSLGHSGADFETAIAAIEAGARHATHLFNRMTPIAHREPGLAGAVLAREEMVAELICDGYHVHPAMCRVAMSAKGTGGVMAITDATGAAGLPIGATARLGGQPIRAGEHAAFLEDGTLAGSTLTMDLAFRNIVAMFGGSIVDAAAMCSTTPARQLGLTGFGVLAEGAVADVTLLDRAFRVARTFVDGVEVWSRSSSGDSFRTAR